MEVLPKNLVNDLGLKNIKDINDITQYRRSYGTGTAGYTPLISILVIILTLSSPGAYSEDVLSIMPRNNLVSIKCDKLKFAYNIIKDSYPRYRYFDGAFSLIFGWLATYNGITVLQDETATSSERIIAYALLGIGPTRMIDGLSCFFFPTRIEKSLVEFKNMQRITNKEILHAETWLKEGAEIEKFFRYFRVFLIGGTSIAYLSLGIIDYKKHTVDTYVGMLLVGITVYKLLTKSPAEKAWEYYRRTERVKKKEETSSFNLYFSPYYKCAIARICLKF